MADHMDLRAEGDRVTLRVAASFPGRLSQLVAQVREQLPGLAVDWTAVREAYRFGRDRYFPVASRQTEHALAEKAKIRFSADDLAAYLLLFPPKLRGRRLEEEELQALAAAYGIPPRLVDGGALRRALLRKAYHEPEVIARGRPPVDGHPAWVHWPAGLPSDAEGFLAAFAELGEYPDVVLAEAVPGTPAGEYHPPGAGAPGLSARGEALASRPGGDPVRLGQGLRREAKGGTILADAVGHLRLAGVGGIRAEVVPLLRVRDAHELRDRAVPVFPGSVVVEGDLEVAFPVRILGDLEVRGALIRSTVEVLGSLFVRDGIIQKGRAPVRVGGLAVAGFLDHGAVQAGTVLIRRYSLKSQVLALDAVLTAEGGSIQGGTVGAGREIRVGTLGSANALATEAAVGTPSLADLYRALYLGWAEALDQETPDRPPPGAEVLAAAAHWKQTGSSLALPDAAEMRLRAQTAHPGVTVRLGTATRAVENAVGPAEFLFEKVGPRGRVSLTRV